MLFKYFGYKPLLFCRHDRCLNTRYVCWLQILDFRSKNLWASWIQCLRCKKNKKDCLLAFRAFYGYDLMVWLLDTVNASSSRKSEGYTLGKTQSLFWSLCPKGYRLNWQWAGERLPHRCPWWDHTWRNQLCYQEHVQTWCRQQWNCFLHWTGNYFLIQGNFLFKQHCGEMSLQKAHRQGKMKHGAERKMDCDEFLKLIN